VTPSRLQLQPRQRRTDFIDVGSDISLKLESWFARGEKGREGFARAHAGIRQTPNNCFWSQACYADFWIAATIEEYRHYRPATRHPETRPSNVGYKGGQTLLAGAA
jgi:hypothetical protein